MVQKIFFLILFLFIKGLIYGQCASNATSTSDEEILNVTFGTLNNSSTCASTGGAGSILNEYSNYAYAGFAGGIPNVDRGCSIPFSIQIGTCGGSYGNSLAIFIDWNNDLIFGAGEQVYTSAASTTGPHTETGNISVPVTATLGNCKMRVVNVESTPASIVACGTYLWGETEDYFINVTNTGGVAPYVSSSVNQVVSGSVSQCAIYQQVISIPIVMGAGCTAGNLTQFLLGAGVSTNLLADVSKIHIFYTGSSNVFQAVNEFVVGGTTPTGASNTINGSQALLANSTNYFWIAYDMNPGSTLGDLIDGSCSQITISGVNHIPSTSNPAGNGNIVVCPCSFSLGADVTLCAPINYTINGPSGFDTYTWTPGGASTQNLTVTSAGTYTCSATLINGGLVTNGDFSSGNTAFTTNYILGTGGTWGPVSNPGTFSITTSPTLAHSNFYTFGDHTTGTGNMLVCNGSAVANDVAWSQTITVTPNTMYNFSAWVASTENTTSGSEALLQFSINGVLIGAVYNAPLTGGVWANFFVNWNSSANTSAVIKIVDQNISGGANDFALDDINFERVCTFTDIIVINSAATTTVAVPANITGCSGLSVAASSFTSSTAGVTYTWTNTNTAIGLAASGTGNTPTFSATNSGTTTITSIITVTPSVGACLGTPKSYTITINPNPTLIVAVTNSVICLGGNTTLTGGGASTYIWTGGITNGVAFSPTVTGTYTLTSTSALGCTNTAVKSITVSPIPTVTANATNSIICLGSSTTLNGGGASTYTWTGGVTNGVAFSPTVTNTYTVTGTSVAGCTNTAIQSVTVNTSPMVTVNSPTTCAGVATLLSANGAISYSWSTGATTQTINPSPITQTVYTVTGTTSGCTATATSTVSVNAALSVTVNSPTICSGTSTVLTANGAISYTWSTGATTSTISVTPTTSTNYSVTGETSGCMGTNTLTVTVNSLPSIASTTATVCTAGTATLTASGGTTYTWTPGALTGASVAVTPSGTTTYTVIGSDGICTNTATGIVQVSPCAGPCTFTLGNDTSFCLPLIYTINGPVGYNFYSWTPGGATTQNLQATTPGTYTCKAFMYSNDLVVNGDFSAGNTGFTTNYALGTGGTWGPVSNAGTYSITTDPNLAHTNFSHFGDHTSGTGNMMVVNGSNTPNDVVWSQTITVTPNTMYNFSAWLASPSSESVTDAAQLQFSINGGLVGPVVTAPLAAGVWANFFVNWNSGASTSAVITIIDNVLAGNNDFVLDDIFFQQVCTASDSIVITGNPQPTVTASVTNSIICLGSSTTLNGGGASTYTWTGGVTNGVAFSPTVTNTYTVTGTSVSGCTNTAVQSVTVNTLPILTINTPTACIGASASFTASGASSYTWSPAMGLSLTSGSVVIGNPNSTTVYSISGTNNGCIGSVTGTFVVVPLPNVVLTASSNTLLSMESVIVTASGGGTYVWNTGETAPTINPSPQQTAVYCVTVTSASGCKNSDCITITVMEISTLYVPNVFTPNGDGVNDVYFLMSTNIVNFNLNIFNRWGQLIFNSDQPSKGWDGTFGGKEVPDGVYIYLIDAKGVDNVIYKKTGHVTVLR